MQTVVRTESNSILKSHDTQRLALLADYPEQKSISVDLCAEMLALGLARDYSQTFSSRLICPPFTKYCLRVPYLNKKGLAYTTDYRVNCFWKYPSHLKRIRSEFDFFHVCDHTYAHLVHQLPAQKTGVFCHDIHAFMSLLDPENHWNSPWYNLIHKHILAGLQKAAVVFYTTNEVRRQIEAYQVVSSERLVQVPLGVAPEFQERSAGVSGESQTVLERLGETPFLLVVGGSTQRKRLDVVLKVFQEIRYKFPEIKLVRVGRKPDDWKESHLQQIKAGQLEESIIYFHNLDRETLAELYRRSNVVMVASEAEGFGLPVIEALACGAVVVASDISVLREVGGQGAVFCPVGDVQSWTEKIVQILSSPNSVPPKEIRIDQVKQYSWKNHVDIIANTYAHL